MSSSLQRQPAQNDFSATGTAPNVETANVASSNFAEAHSSAANCDTSDFNASSSESVNFETELAKARALARTRQTPILLSVALRVPALDLVALFAASVDAERFLFEQPTQSFGLLGLGAAALLEAHDTKRFAAIRAQATALTQNILRCGDAISFDSKSPLFTPKFVGGFAFEDDPHTSQLWNAFPLARFVLPQAQIEKRGEMSCLLLQALVDANTDIEEIARRWQERRVEIFNTATTQAQTTNSKSNFDSAQIKNDTFLRNETLDASSLPAENAIAATEKIVTRSAFALLPLVASSLDPSNENELLCDLQHPKAPREPSPAVREHYLAIVRKALAAIERNELEKAVVARSTTLFCRRTLSSARMLRELRATYPRCTLFAVTQDTDTFLGATPERLVSLAKHDLHIDALAGSAPRGATPEADAQNRSQLENSRKERHEHALVVQSIREAIHALCETLQIPDAPRVLELDAIQHLHSPITGRAAAVHTVLDFVEALHPTAAIAGAPREAAKRWLAQNEDLERGWYSGPVGWFDSDGSGDFSVALRCALLKPTQALFFAGAGIVADSDPMQELEETRLKLRASLLAFLEIEA